MSSIRFPIIDDCVCGDKTYQQFFQECIPFFNMETYRDFILYEHKQDSKFVSINSPNGFVVDNKCIEESGCKGYILDFEKTELTSMRFSEISESKVKMDITATQFFNELQHMINFDMNITYTEPDKPKSMINFDMKNNQPDDDQKGILTEKNITIPYYYFYIKPDTIFELFILAGSPNANEIFVLDRSNRFITMSDDFNIFNISLFTYKYFDIIAIFDFYFNVTGNKISSDIKEFYKIRDRLKIELGKIFPNENFVVSMMNLYKFRKFITGMGSYSKYTEFCKYRKYKDTCMSESEKCKWIEEVKKCKPIYNLKDKFYESHVDEKIYNCKNEEKKDNKNFWKSNFWKSNYFKKSDYKDKEDKALHNYTYENFLTEMVNDIVKIGDNLIKISNLIQIPQYKYIFLISIFSFRLTKKFLAGSWGFIYSIYLEFLKSRKQPNPAYEHLESVFNKSDLPLIYEYSKVNFMGQEYGNCMENTILQFIKLLFWDTKERNYNIKLIDSIVRDKYQLEIYNYLKNIDKEKENAYVEKWVKFISYTIVNDNDYPNIKYNFLREKQGKDKTGTNVDIELNPIFDNMYMSLIKIFNIEIEEEKNTEDKVRVINTFLEKNNTFIKEIEVKTEEKNSSQGPYIVDIVKVKTQIKEYIVELLNGMHAYFKESVKHNSYYIIVNNFEEKQKLIWDNLENGKIKPQFYDNILQYIMLKYFFGKGQIKASELKIYDKYKELYFTKYKFNDLGIWNNNLRKLTEEEYKKLCVDIKERHENGKIILSTVAVFKYIYNRIPNKEDTIIDMIYLYTTNVPDRDPIFLQRLYNGIIGEIKKLEKDKQKQIWKRIIEKERTEPVQFYNFFRITSTHKDILEYFNENKLWEPIMNTNIIESKTFMQLIAKNDNVIQYFTDHNIWETIIDKISIGEFWEQIAKNEKILEYFPERNIWERIIDKIRINEFWEQIAIRDTVLDYFTNRKLWETIIDKIRTIEFWRQIATKENILEYFPERNIWERIIDRISLSYGFWEQIAIRDTVLDYFTEYNDGKLWETIIDKIDNGDFWELIAKNNKILDYFTENNLWVKIIYNLRFISKFWEQIATKEKILDYFSRNNLWGELIDNLRDNEFGQFWEQIKTKVELSNELREKINETINKNKPFRLTRTNAVGFHR